MLSRLLGLDSRSQAVNEAVWFSRDIHNNQLRHWMLVVRGRIYELVRTPEGNFTFVCARERGWTPVFEQQNRGRNRGRTQGRHGNGLDGWTAVYIGKSRLSGREIEQRFATVRAPYPPRLSWAQCQDFLRRFAHQLVDSRDPEYWPFFITSTAIERRTVALLPPPPMALVRLEQARERERAREQADVTRRAGNLNAMQAGFLRAQEQNMATNMQIMQNNQNFGWYGS
jgi:hypothetical protein